MTRWLLALVALLIAAGLAGHSETFREKVENRHVDIIPDGDPAMAAAVKKARATMPEFLATSQHPKAGTSGYAVKIGLGPASAQEFFWIAPFTIAGDTVTGPLDNEPETIEGYHKGQVVHVPIAQLTDWMYFDGDRMKGNYSACALLTHEPQEEQDGFKQQYGLDCAAEEGTSGARRLSP